MNVNSHNVTLLFVFIIGVFFLLIGMKAKKVEEKRQAGILSICMAICAFAFCILEILVDVLKPTHSWKHTVSIIELIIGGVWLGFYVVMLIFRHFKLLMKTREISDRDSQKTGELK
jgi:NhaP-type Na+/H+ or K+/H+ antiporter